MSHVRWPFLRAGAGGKAPHTEALGLDGRASPSLAPGTGEASCRGHGSHAATPIAMPAMALPRSQAVVLGLEKAPCVRERDPAPGERVRPSLAIHPAVHHGVQLLRVAQEGARPTRPVPGSWRLPRSASPAQRRWRGSGLPVHDRGDLSRRHRVVRVRGGAAEGYAVGAAPRVSLAWKAAAPTRRSGAQKSGWSGPAQVCRACRPPGRLPARRSAAARPSSQAQHGGAACSSPGQALGCRA